MVLGLLGITAIPVSLGISQAVKEQHNDPDEEAERDRECHLSVYCDASSPKHTQVHGKNIVLRDNKAYVCDLKDPSSHPFAGFYIGYPSDDKPRGLVTMVSHNPPAMGWLYADKDTLELKYGNRTASIDHVKGPWDWTADKAGLTLEGKEAFVVVEEADGEWAVYYDRRENGRGLPKGKTVMPISIDRKPTKPKEVKQETPGKSVKKSEG